MSRFISLEGPEGSGKTTQLRLLRAYLEGRGVPVVLTREPGGTAIGDQVRQVLHDLRNDDMLPRTEVLLYSASRAQLVGQVIRPALAAGVTVLCDRFAESTLAYQGYGRGLDLAALHMLADYATGGLRPDLVIYLDLPVQVGLERKLRAHELEHDEWTRMDQQQVEFHERVRQGYLTMAAQDPARWRLIDARQPVEAVQAEIRRCVGELIGVLWGQEKGDRNEADPLHCAQR